MTEFTRQASDVSCLPKAPDVAFEVTPQAIRADVDGFSVRITMTGDSECLVSIDLDDQPYCRCVYLPTKSPHFEEEDITHEVTGFACGVLWSAWRRRELARRGETQ